MRVREEHALQLAGYTLALVSTGALVVLLVSLPMGKVEKSLATCAGVALQVCLYLFSRTTTKRSRAMACILLLVSVTATAAFMEQAWQTHISQQTLVNDSRQAESYQVQALRQSLNILDQQIRIRLDVSARDTSGSYRTRGLEELDNVTDLQQQRTEVLQQLEQLQQQGISTGAEAGSMQALLAGSNRNTRLALFALLALLIDLSALLAMGVQQPAAADKPQPEDQPEQPDDNTEQDEACPVGHLRDRILSGDFGNPPSQRQAVAEVKQAFDGLAEDGHLAKVGNRFELVNEVIEVEP